MQFIFKEIITIIIAIIMQNGVSGTVSTTPDEAIQDFLEGVRTQQQEVLDKHMDNTYINFLSNIQGDEAVVDRMQEALFRNFSYEIEDIGEKNNVAVAKVSIRTNDFSQVLSKYETASYKYVMENLYTDSIGDKDALNAECLDIYVQQIEAAANEDTSEAKTVFIPMIDNGHYGWNIVVSDELMVILLGGLQVPEL